MTSNQYVSCICHFSLAKRLSIYLASLLQSPGCIHQHNFGLPGCSNWCSRKAAANSPPLGVSGVVPTARNFLTRPPTGRYFHPPYPPIASQSISRDVPLARARAFQSSSPLVKGAAKTALYCAHRTSTLLIVRVLRARRAPGRSLPILLTPRVTRAQGSPGHPPLASRSSRCGAIPASHDGSDLPASDAPLPHSLNP